MLSDGDDTVSLVTFDALLELARKRAVAVYTLTLGSFTAAKDDPDARFGRVHYQMRTELEGMYSSIARELARQYLLGYLVPRGALRGQFRRVTVVANRRDVRVRTRSGYVAGV